MTCRHSGVTKVPKAHLKATEYVLQPATMHPYLKTRRQQTMSTLLWWGTVAVGVAMLVWLLAC